MFSGQAQSVLQLWKSIIIIGNEGFIMPSLKWSLEHLSHSKRWSINQFLLLVNATHYFKSRLIMNIPISLQTQLTTNCMISWIISQTTLLLQPRISGDGWIVPVNFASQEKDQMTKYYKGTPSIPTFNKIISLSKLSFCWVWALKKPMIELVNLGRCLSLIHKQKMQISKILCGILSIN